MFAFIIVIFAGATSSVRQQSEIASHGLHQGVLDAEDGMQGALSCCKETFSPEYLCLEEAYWSGRVYTTARESPATLPTERSWLMTGSPKEIKFTPDLKNFSSCSGDEVDFSKDTSLKTPTYGFLVKDRDFVGTEVAYVEEIRANSWKAIKLGDKVVPSTLLTDFPNDKHIEIDGVVYGPPSPSDPPQDSLHGKPVCVKYQKTATVSMTSGEPTFNVDKNGFDFRTTCKEEYTCVKWNIAHACGFVGAGWSYFTNFVYLLKRKGRMDNSCEVVHGESCPIGTWAATHRFQKIEDQMTAWQL